MAAPTPVSAYLHSATMVKAGIFVLIRLWPVLAGTDLWYFIVSTTGLATLLVGAWAAIFQQDLKGLLAYSHDRKSVVSGKSVSVRVCLGGGRIIKKQKNT